MRVLITGGMGFIGRAVTNKLLKKDIDSVVILDNLLPKVHGQSTILCEFNDKRVSFLKGDVSLRADIEPIIISSDIILHLAAETGTGQSMYEIEHYNRVNISATAIILDILSNKCHRVKKIVIASSRAIYGEGKYLCPIHHAVYPKTRHAQDLAKGKFDVRCPLCGKISEVTATDEDSMVHPTSFYGITKQVQESMVMTLCPHLGITPVALRYQNVYGPGQSLINPYTGILSIFSNLIRLGKHVDVFEDGMETRDFVFIDDVADVTSDAILSDRADGKVLNVGSGIPTTVLEVAQKLREMFASNVEIRITGKYRAGDIRHNYADLSRIRRALHFKPGTSLDQGLGMFVDWVSQQEVVADLYNGAINEMELKGLYR